MYVIDRLSRFYRIIIKIIYFFYFQKEQMLLKGGKSYTRGFEQFFSVLIFFSSTMTEKARVKGKKKIQAL